MLQRGNSMRRWAGLKCRLSSLVIAAPPRVSSGCVSLVVAAAKNYDLPSEEHEWPSLSCHFWPCSVLICFLSSLTIFMIEAFIKVITLAAVERNHSESRISE